MALFYAKLIASSFLLWNIWIEYQILNCGGWDLVTFRFECSDIWEVWMCNAHMDIGYLDLSPCFYAIESIFILRLLAIVEPHNNNLYTRDGMGIGGDDIPWGFLYVTHSCLLVIGLISYIYLSLKECDGISHPTFCDIYLSLNRCPLYIILGILECDGISHPTFYAWLVYWICIGGNEVVLGWEFWNAVELAIQLSMLILCMASFCFGE